MKNISLPSTKEICNDCRDIGYFTEYTPREKGADGLLCPLCNKPEFYFGETLEQKLLRKFEDINYCINCNIIHNGGCIHSSCYFDILMNSHFINIKMTGN